MAADTNATIVRVRAVVEGLPGLNQLKTAMRGISAESKSANVDLRLVNAQLRNLGTETNKSINNLRLQKQAFEAVRNSARIGSDAYKEATLRLKELNRELDKTQAGGGGGGRGRGLATIGTVAGAGFFGGPEALLGAAVGGIFAGPPGAAAGAGIGAGASGLRQQAAGISDYVKELNLAKITLAQASTSQADFNRNLQIARQISTDYSVGLKETVNGYAQVSVAARANGLTVQQTEAIYRGVISASVAFGKSQEDLDAIVRATVQVLSKGKVSAEEMGGQIGERLPGAVAKFAQATGRSLPELAKDFEQGKVTIADFVKFTEKQVNDYDEIAKIIGASPEKAGARLKLALDTAAENYGGFFQNIGAGMQDNLAKMLSWVNKNSEFLKRYAAFWFNLGRDISRAVGFIAGTIFNLGKGIFKVFTDVALFVPRKIAQAFGTTPEKIFGKLTGAVGGALAQYTKNYADYFPEFKVPAGAFGTDQGGGLTGDLADEGGKTKKAPKIPVTRIGDMIGKSRLDLELATKELRIQELINQAKKDGNEYDAQVLPLIEGLLRSSTKITQEEEKLGDLVQNKNILLKQGMSIQEYNARYEASANNIEEGRLIRKKEFLKFQQQESEITKKINEDEIAARSLIQKALLDAQTQSMVLTEEDRKRMEINKILADVIDKIYGKLTNEELLEAIRQLRKGLEDAANAGKDFGSKLGKSFADVVKASGELAQNLGASLGNAFTGLGDQLAEFVTTGKMQFGEFARSVLNDLARIFIQFAMFQTLKGLVPSGSAFGKFLGFANGGIMTGNGALPLKRYAAGGIATSPQLAMFGEGSRPEAYVPLPDGRTIPVTMKGGGQMGNIVVNVDAGGTSVQGNQPDANKLGEALGAAVRAELIRQKRPGGLLS